jgi:hypothetical protein
MNDFTLIMPIPPSVNRTRRVDWRGNKARKQFYLRCDLFLSAYGPQPLPFRLIKGPYELDILIPMSSRLDLNNHDKVMVDYLVEREFVRGDSQKYLRGYSVHWAPIEHCRVTIRGLE